MRGLFTNATKSPSTFDPNRPSRQANCTFVAKLGRGPAERGLLFSDLDRLGSCCGYNGCQESAKLAPMRV